MTDTVKTEDEREKFESWYWNEFGQFEDGDARECFAFEEGNYYRLGPRMSWGAWQARGALTNPGKPDLTNSFSDLDLQMMCHGNNPVSNAYRELLEFRQARAAQEGE